MRQVSQGPVGARGIEREDDLGAVVDVVGGLGRSRADAVGVRRAADEAVEGVILAGEGVARQGRAEAGGLQVAASWEC